MRFKLNEAFSEISYKYVKMLYYYILLHPLNIPILI